MNCGLSCSRNSFRLILLSCALANCLFLVVFELYPDTYPKLMRFLATNISSSGANVNRNKYFSNNRVQIVISADDQYRQMTTDYMGRIASIPRHNYNPTDAYIDIGQPISSLANVSDSLFSESKLILLWTRWFRVVNWVGNNTFKGCKYSRCHVTTDKSKLSQSHAIVFHAPNLKRQRSLPPKREPWQRWIYFTAESPAHNTIRLADFNNVFNRTVTFRLDADILIGYGRLCKRRELLKPRDLDDITSNIVKSKTKLVSATISNCGPSTRRKYIDELQKYIHVDFFGRCGSWRLPRGDKEVEILKQYKFHLAFENSHCRDYITEKFWRPLAEWSSVPVVMGAAPEDYLHIAPNQSFIHTVGFESPRKLAEYIQLLDRNDALYQRHFTWLAEWKPCGQNPWCDVCSDLHNMSSPLKSYRNFKAWYREDYCNRGK